MVASESALNTIWDNTDDAEYDQFEFGQIVLA